MMRNRTLVLLVAFGLAAGLAALAQDAPIKPDPAKPSKTEATKKPALVDAVRVSTTEALTSAAKKEAKKDSAVAKEKDSASDTVTEFHAVTPSTTNSTDPVVTKEKSSAKQFHGEAYGALGAGGNQESG